jgi:hypothetical protein
MMGEIAALSPAQIQSAADAPSGVSPEIAALFEQIALEVYRSGKTKFSARAILHRIRWYHSVERGDDSFKINNNTSAKLARWFMKRHPVCRGFFELREKKAESE